MKTRLVVALATFLAALPAAAGPWGENHDRRAEACRHRQLAGEAPGALTAWQAGRYLQAQMPAGQVVYICADGKDTAPPHYHVDVRLPDGMLGRLNVQAVDGRVTWREPAMLQD